MQLRALKIAFCLYKCSRNSIFTFAITVLFCLSVGISFAEFLILDSIYFITKSVTDVPTGMLADYYDRRKLLMWSCGIGAISFWIIALRPTFWSIAAAEVLYGLSQSLASGADSAFLFASLSAGGKEEDYAYVESVGKGVATLAFAAACGIGALIAAAHGYTIVYWITGFAILAGAPALLLVPPNRGSPRPARKKLNLFTLELLNTYLKSPVLLFAAGSFVLLFATVRAGVWSIQPVLGAVGIATAWYGVIMSVLLLLSAAISFAMRNIEASVNNRNLVFLFLPPAVFLLGVAAALNGSMALTGLLALAMFVPIAISHGSFNQLLLTWVNVNVDDAKRASALSVMSALGSIGYAASAPLFGAAVDRFGIVKAFAVAGCAYAVFALVLISAYRAKVNSIRDV